MIALGLRLTFRAGRDAVVRLLITAAAVALGVGLLLTTLASVNATRAQSDRNAWLNTSFTERSGPRPGVDPVWWLTRADNIDGELIARIDVAPTGPNPPLPPGVSRLPAPGTLFASPALAELLRDRPHDELADRYPGTVVGLIGREALPSPDSLVAVVGRTPDELAHTVDARQVSHVADTPPSSCNGCVVGVNEQGMTLVLTVAATAIIVPILVLIGTATRLAATRREQRFAAMRLVGATPRQTAVLSAVESTVAAAVGAAAGFALFYLLRPWIAGFSFTTDRFYTSDLVLGTGDILAVALGVPVAAAVAARVALRRVQISPLGVTRRVTPPPPRWYRVLPLVAGLAELGYFVGRRPVTVNGQIWAYTSAFVVIMLGLVYAGPWLTMAGARAMARRTGRPAVLIAGRRLADNPKAGFRAISGLVLALFVTTAAAAIVQSMADNERNRFHRRDVADVLIVDFTHQRGPRAPQDSAPPPATALLDQVRGMPGVRGLTVLHTNPLGVPYPYADDPQLLAGLADCTQLATTSGFGECASGARVAAVPPEFDGWMPTGRLMPWPGVDVTPERLADIPMRQLVVATDGDTHHVERVRTLLATMYPGEGLPTTISERDSWGTRDLAGQERLAEVVILVSLPIAACSLAVAAAGGLADRKRPFSLLRLTGVPLGMLRRVVGLETVVPLLLGAAVATGTGFLAAHLFLRAQLGYALEAPDAGYYLVTGVGLAAALAVIASTLPLLARVTGPETARNE
ncbi:FtsX-like permease family protein [Yinghuangia seranimata]|uniref:FtsX-like permease family protein n=1 Tax=Yinghuangia seranimata TaxID=408067 RepID=UPI00248CED6A|nr:FtsX-like permease family protein [Yinghuangia seranimata]MDI2129594.1 hypothetical protein [Yinghuangia seranimata]